MNKIEKISKIKYKNIDNKQYLKSLINESFNLGLISQTDIERIQIELLELLDNIIYKYNGKENSSIRKELAERINDSNIYTIGMALKKNHYIDDSLEMIKTNDMTNLYEIGEKEIIKNIKQIKVIYSKVIQNKLDIDNEIYNDTIIGGINGFLKIYDYEFNAQDMKITADYPLYNNIIGKFEGVEFIKEYLKSIYYENEFCNLFKLNCIQNLLYSYAKDYKYLVENVFSIVLLESIGCKIANTNIGKLSITNFDLEKIKKVFNNKTNSEIEDTILDAYISIKKEMFNSNKNLQEYIEKNLKEILFLIKNSYKNNILEKVFIVNNII